MLHYLLAFRPLARPCWSSAPCETEEVGLRHPLTTLLNDLRSAGQLTEISLVPLDASETAEPSTCAWPGEVSIPTKRAACTTRPRASRCLWSRLSAQGLALD